MFGIIFGLGCLYALYRINRPGGFRGGCDGPRGRRRGRRGRARFFDKMADFKLDRLLRTIDASPEQADEITAAFSDLRAEVLPLRAAFRGSRQELAEAMRDDEVAEERIDAVFSVHRDALETAQAALKRAMERVHLALTATQRAQVADHFARYASAGPYR